MNFIWSTASIGVITKAVLESSDGLMPILAKLSPTNHIALACDGVRSLGKGCTAKSAQATPKGGDDHQKYDWKQGGRHERRQEWFQQKQNERWNKKAAKGGKGKNDQRRW